MPMKLFASDVSVLPVHCQNSVCMLSIMMLCANQVKKQYLKSNAINGYSACYMVTAFKAMQYMCQKCTTPEMRRYRCHAQQVSAWYYAQIHTAVRVNFQS